MPAGNTREAFADFIGKKCIGVLFGALPLTNPGIARRCKTLVFEDGRGLTFSDNGSFWIEDAADVKAAVRAKENELRRVGSEIESVLALAGAVT